MREGHKEYPPQEYISEQNVDRYIAEHRHKPEWKDVDAARNWGLKNVLSYFENECHTLKDKLDLKEVRELTAFIDRSTPTSAKFNKSLDELIIDLEQYRDADYRLLHQENASHEAQEKEIADGNRDSWNEDINGFKNGHIENVLRRVEDRTAFLNQLIDNDTELLYHQGESSRNSTQHRIKTNTAKRDAARQTRANLLRQYLQQGSIH